jgi:outer membrane protein
VAALVTSAEETLRLAEGRYEAGTGSIIEVTDAQAVYTQSRLSGIQAEYDVETARARLQRALGSFSGAERK